LIESLQGRQVYHHGSQQRPEKHLCSVGNAQRQTLKVAGSEELSLAAPLNLVLGPQPNMQWGIQNELKREEVFFAGVMNYFINNW